MTSAAGAFMTGLAGGVQSGEDIKKRREEIELRREELEAAKNAPRGVIGNYGESGGGSAGGSGETFQYDGKISDRASYAFDYFKNAGLPDHVAAGLTGNLMQESGADINPAAVGDGGNAFGAGQWNGPRKRSYMAYASNKGVDPTDFDTQLEYLLHEGQTTERGAWSDILNTKTAEEAATVASQRFWRPGIPHNERRAGYARSIYDQYGGANAGQPSGGQGAATTDQQAPQGLGAAAASANVQTAAAGGNETNQIGGVLQQAGQILQRFYK